MPTNGPGEVHGRLLEAVGRGDMQAAAACFAENAVWHVPGRSAVAGDHEGPTQILAFLGRVFELTGGTFQHELIDRATSDSTAIAWQRITATREGKTLDEKEAIVFEVRDGLIAEVWHRPDQYPFDAFFS